jgi:signal transduction histidine kinase
MFSTNNTKNSLNNRILIIDDEESVCNFIRFILMKEGKENKKLIDAANELFEEHPQKVKHNHVPDKFEITIANNGKAALELVEQAQRDDKPFAAIFCDMRMPGWDGLQTIDEIRKVDERAEVIFVTAYADHSIEGITERVGANISYLVKPFVPEELLQFAIKSVYEWNKAREFEGLLETLSTLRGHKEDLDSLIQYFLDQLCRLIGTDSAALFRIDEKGRIEYKVGTGNFQLSESISKITTYIQRNLETNHEYIVDDLFVYPINEFGLAVVIANPETVSTERRYLIRVFIEHTGMILRNNEIAQALREQERMAEIGKLMAFVSHDLRSPIGQAEMLIKLIPMGENSPLTLPEITAKISLSLDQALQMVNDILLFSKGELTIKKDVRDLHVSVDVAKNYWLYLAQSQGVTLLIDIDRNPILANLDHDRCIRAITNLVKNAIDVSSVRQDGVVKLIINKTNDGVLITVSDNGAGIPKQVLDNLFQPFATAGKAHGTGFGLAIVKQISDAHEGNLTFETSGNGTTFTMLLPK